MLVFFSSHQYEYPADPEVVITDAAVMVSFINNRKKIHDRTAQLIRHRKGRRDEAVLRGGRSRVGRKARAGSKAG